jgi:glycosyltransferase involved in cell wall biosynthesis
VVRRIRRSVGHCDLTSRLRHVQIAVCGGAYSFAAGVMFADAVKPGLRLETTVTASLALDPRLRVSEGVAVVIPALNEAESIGAVITALPRHLVDRIIVADGGSTDGTPQIARAAGAEVIVVGPGYGRACLAGAEAATDISVLVFMDGDGADDPSAIGEMVSALRSGSYDFVVGSRTRGKREASSMAGHQILAGIVIGQLIRALYGVRYTDMSAFRAIHRADLLQLGMQEMTYGWNLEMQMRAARGGLRTIEIPVGYRRRSGGLSKVSGNLRGSIKAAARIVATFLRVAMETKSK